MTLIFNVGILTQDKSPTQNDNKNIPVIVSEYNERDNPLNKILHIIQKGRVVCFFYLLRQGILRKTKVLLRMTSGRRFLRLRSERQGSVWDYYATLTIAK